MKTRVNMTMLCLLLVLSPVAATAGVYKCTDAQGRTVFSDHACASARQDVSRAYAAPKAAAPPVEEASSSAPGKDPKGDGKAGKDTTDAAPSAPRDIGAANVQKFLDGRQADKEQSQQKRAAWLESSAELDRAREQRQQDEAREQRYQDCERENRIRDMRGQRLVTCRR
ncbi:MAG TPA: DUF4124 domain-containing protein [Solimonas sp.]|nr:DUF4124 domain-containing protein [Solimonas sp.]